VPLPSRKGSLSLKDSLEQSRRSGMESVEALQRDQAGFEHLATLLQEWAGIHLPLNSKNLSLMAGRLSRVLELHGARNYSEYAQMLSLRQAELGPEFISAMTTNTTQFFREDHHFKILQQKVVPELLKRNSSTREIRVWCSASSTGQEPYTLAIVLSEALKAYPLWKVKILATDIDHEVLEKAREGIYTEEESSSLPPLYRQKYFSLIPTEGAPFFQVKPSLRSLVVFRQFNLLSDSYSFTQPFDVVFCRNVLIYFDRKDCEYVVQSLTRSLSHMGHLFLGHAEAGTLRNADLVSVASAVGQKTEHSARRRK